jgi:carbon-monoxide dehydrogenase medium subunit
MLSLHGEQAKVLSGGQSLLPAMNFRLVSPQFLIDIGELAELRGLAVDGDVLRIGALTRHVELLTSPLVGAHAPLLSDAVKHIAHPAIRNRGTLGGSLAHADPAAELPACMLALDATIIACGRYGERRIAAAEFFQGIYATALRPDELLAAVELPIARQNSVDFFQEFARRHGDYALAGVAARASVVNRGFSNLRMAFFAIADRPVLANAAAKLLNVAITPELIADAAVAFGNELDPPEDQQVSSSMRRHLARVLFRRCVEALLTRGALCGAAG